MNHCLQTAWNTNDYFATSLDMGWEIAKVVIQGVWILRQEKYALGKL